MRVLVGKDELPRGRFTARWLWEPRDIWVGVFWNRVRAGGPADRFLLVYIGLLPCLPLCLTWRLAEAGGSHEQEMT